MLYFCNEFQPIKLDILPVECIAPFIVFFYSRTVWGQKSTKNLINEQEQQHALCKLTLHKNGIILLIGTTDSKKYNNCFKHDLKCRKIFVSVWWRVVRMLLFLSSFQVNRDKELEMLMHFQNVCAPTMGIKASLILE